MASNWYICPSTRYRHTNLTHTHTNIHYTHTLTPQKHSPSTILKILLLSSQQPNLDESCANDMQCPNEKACIGGKCSDPCSLRGACGDNALCQTVLHRPRCSCPSCYIGRPNVECKPDPKCKEATTQKPSDPKIVSIACEKDADCDESLRCDASGQCNDPCTIPTTYVCDPNKKCISRRHRPVCVCKHGFIVNDYGELICAPEKRECHGDDGCASNMACIDGKCLNPCMPTATRGPACPEDKACMVMDHKPACVCMKDCSPTLSISSGTAGVRRISPVVTISA